MNPTLRNEWIYRPKPNADAKARLICFHFAGGSAQTYRSWGSALFDVVEVCAIQLPGRADRARQKPFLSLAPLIEELRTEFEAQLLDKPFAFFGHSMGALVAFELARSLRKHRLAGPRALIAAAYPGPHMSLLRDRMSGLSDAELVSKLGEMFSDVPNFQLFDDDVVRQFLLPPLRADLTVVESYACSAEPPLDTPIVALGGEDDRMVPLNLLKEWAKQTTAEFEYRLMPGGHFFWLTREQPLLAIIASKLTAYL